jgi:hypothetical protein
MAFEQHSEILLLNDRCGNWIYHGNLHLISCIIEPDGNVKCHVVIITGSISTRGYFKNNLTVIVGLYEFNYKNSYVGGLVNNGGLALSEVLSSWHV